MSEPKKRRTSKKVREPAGNVRNSKGDIVAAASASVENVDLRSGTTMTVGDRSLVEWVTDVKPRTLAPVQTLIQLGEDAEMQYIRVEYESSGAGPMTANLILEDRARLVGHLRRHGAGSSPVTLGDVGGVYLGEDAEVLRVWLTGEISIGAHTKVVEGNLSDTSVGAHCTLRTCSLSGARIGSHCVLTNVAGAAVIGDRSLIEDALQIGNGIRVGEDTIIAGTGYGAVRINARFVAGAGCRIGAYTVIGSDVVFGNRVFVDTTRGGGAISDRVSIGSDVRIGGNVEIGTHSKIGDGVVIGHDTHIDGYVTVDPGVKIGVRVHIKSGTRVREDVADDTLVDGAVASLPDITVHATAESWMLNRVADVMEAAGQKRLDKRALAKEMPTLVETHCVRQLLRMAPPPDVATMREMAAQFACTPKYTGEAVRPTEYVASVKPRGWEGVQVMSGGANDVIVFRATEQALDALVPGFSRGVKSWQAGYLRALLLLGKTESHPGGMDPYVIGWARVVFNESERSVLCEELQTDLAFLAWDLASEVWHLADDAGTRLSGHPSSGIAKLLTTEGVPAGRWAGSTAPYFTKDKEAQQKALIALALWNAANHDGASDFRSFNPDMIVHGKKVPDLNWAHWVYLAVAMDMLGDPNFIADTYYSQRETDRMDTVIATAKREWPVEAAQILEDLRGLFSDFYESAIAGVLQIARKAEMKEVWVPDYETKYAIASYSGDGLAPLEPPRSVYTELPKKFGATPVQPLPDYMDKLAWYKEAADRRGKSWVTAQIPDHPRGRRLLANARQRR